jgi:multiple sugar transport system substrate-binding protein
MKKTLILFITFVMMVSLFTSCQRSGGSSGGGSSSARITFFYWDENQRPGMDAVAQAYTRTSGVQVETTITPWAQYWTRLQTSLPSDTGPDVFWCNFSHAIDYYPAGLVQEISTYIQRDNVDMSKFPQVMVDMYSYDGKVYGIPKDYDTIALFYNKAIFDAKGVPYPTDTWTWTDLRRAAERLTDSNVHGFIVGADTQGFLYPWILSNNGSVISSDRSVMRWNTPETAEAINEAIRFVLDGLAPTPADLAELDADSRFQAGLVAMVTTGSWMVPPFYEALGDNLGVARFPIAKKPANVIHGLSFNMSARSRYKDEAWGLLKAFATIEAGEAQAKVVIPAYQGAAEVWKRNFPSLNLQVFIDAAAVADLLPRATRAAAAQDDIVNTQIDNLYMGVTDVATALATIDRECAAAAR